MRRIDQLVVHHSASKRSTTAKEIKKWHLAKGWNDIAYHYIIEEDGNIVRGREDKVIGAHALGNNRHTIGICVVGDNTIPQRQWNHRQKTSLFSLLAMLSRMYTNTTIVQHKTLMPEGYTECAGLLHITPYLQARRLEVWQIS